VLFFCVGGVWVLCFCSLVFCGGLFVVALTVIRVVCVFFFLVLCGCCGGSSSVGGFFFFFFFFCGVQS